MNVVERERERGWVLNVLQGCARIMKIGDAYALATLLWEVVVKGQCFDYRKVGKSFRVEGMHSQLKGYWCSHASCFFDCCRHAPFWEKADISWLRPSYKSPGKKLLTYGYTWLWCFYLENVLWLSLTVTLVLGHSISVFSVKQTERSSYYLTSNYLFLLNFLNVSSWIKCWICLNNQLMSC